MHLFKGSGGLFVRFEGRTEALYYSGFRYTKLKTKCDEYEIIAVEWLCSRHVNRQRDCHAIQKTLKIDGKYTLIDGTFNHHSHKSNPKWCFSSDDSIGLGKFDQGIVTLDEGNILSFHMIVFPFNMCNAYIQIIPLNVFLIDEMIEARVVQENKCTILYFGGFRFTNIDVRSNASLGTYHRWGCSFGNRACRTGSVKTRKVGDKHMILEYSVPKKHKHAPNLDWNRDGEIDYSESMNGTEYDVLMEEANTTMEYSAIGDTPNQENASNEGIIQDFI